MTLSEYSHLKKQIRFIVGTNDKHRDILNSLKEMFRDNINSVRRFEQINNIGELLRVLEIRDVLSEDNVGSLKDIARKLPNHDELLKKITDYEESHVPRDIGNYYAPRPEKLGQNNTTNSPLTDIMDCNKKKERVYQTIIEEIGSFWRDLGRNLKIRECVIDEIDFQNRNLNVKATKLMEAFEEKADRQRWFFVLCTALERSRRRDLVQSIQEIMTMNI